MVGALCELGGGIQVFGVVGRQSHDGRLRWASADGVDHERALDTERSQGNDA